MAPLPDSTNRFQPLVDYPGEPGDGDGGEERPYSPIEPPPLGPEPNSAQVASDQALETTTAASLLPSSPAPSLLAPAAPLVSPARPGVTRTADEIDTPGDKARLQEVSDERRALRRASIQAFNEDDWPPLPNNQLRGRTTKAVPRQGSSKQITSADVFRTRRASHGSHGPASADAVLHDGRTLLPLLDRPAPPPPPNFKQAQGPRRSSSKARAGQRYALTQDVNKSLNIGRGERILVEDSQGTAGAPFLAASDQLAHENPDAETAGSDHVPRRAQSPSEARPGRPAVAREGLSLWDRAAATARNVSARVSGARQFAPAVPRSRAPSNEDRGVDDDEHHTGAKTHDAQMDVDDFTDDLQEFAELPAAQPLPARSDAGEDELEYVEISDIEEPEDLDDQVLHPAFARRTVKVASNGDNDLLDGLVMNGHLAHVLPSQLQAWEEYDGNKAIFICDDLDGQDPSNMNRTAVVKKLCRQFQGAWPDSSPEISLAQQDPNSTQRVRKNTFLIKNIDDDQLAAVTHKKHYIIGVAKITTFTFDIPVSPFMGTVPEICLETDQVRAAVVKQWAKEPSVVTVFDKHLRHRQPSTALRTAFFKSLRVVPMVTKANGEQVVEFNIYADAPYLSPPLHKELRTALKAIRIIDSFAGVIALRDPDWRCTACPSRGHPRGLCKTHEVPGWHVTQTTQAPPTPQARSSGPASTRAPSNTRGGRGGRGRGARQRAA